MSTEVIKYGALVALIAQNSFGVIGMRYTRLAGGPMYLTSVAVLTAEVSEE